MTLWDLEFYRTDADGVRSGGQKVTDGSASIDGAVFQAKSMMEHGIFSFGKANLCLIKSQDGTIVREVVNNARPKPEAPPEPPPVRSPALPPDFLGGEE